MGTARGAPDPTRFGGLESQPSSPEYLQAWFEGSLKGLAGENLLRPKKNAGVLYVRELEGRLKPASVGVKLASVKAFYAALRWSGATDTAPFADVKAPFADVKAAVDKTPAWEKREAYTSTDVH